MIEQSDDPNDQNTPLEDDWVTEFLDSFLKAMDTPMSEEQAAQPGPTDG